MTLKIFPRIPRVNLEAQSVRSDCKQLAIIFGSPQQQSAGGGIVRSIKQELQHINVLIPASFGDAQHDQVLSD
jgi:hypothetical protein